VNRPRTEDPAHWAATHTAKGDLSAEGFLRGYTDFAAVGFVSLRLQLSEFATAGPLRQVVYTLSVRDNATGATSLERFSDLRTARAGSKRAYQKALDLHAARMVAGVEQ